MFFEYPALLWLLVIPAFMLVHYVYIELSGRRPHLRVPDIKFWKAGGRSVLGVIRHLPFLLRTIALVMIIIAIARPRWTRLIQKALT